MLDLRTLALITMMSAVVFFLATVTVWRLVPQERSLRDWGMGSMLMAASSLLLGLRGIAPDFLSIVAGNSALVLSLGFMHLGTRNLFGLGPGHPLHWLAAGAMFLACIVFTYLTPSLPARIAALSILILPFFVACGWLFWRHSEPQPKALDRLTALIFIVGAFLFLVRLSVAAGAPMSPDYLVTPSWTVASPYFYSILFNVWIAIMLTLKVSARLQRQLAQALGHAEAANRSLSDTIDFNQKILLDSPLPMGVYAASGHCVLANDAHAQLAGTTREALLAQNFHSIGTWQKSGLLDACLAALAHAVPQRCEVHVVTSFGKEVWVECRIMPTYLKGERHLLIQYFDMTERKQTEEALRQSRHILYSIVENIPAMVFLKRADDLRFEMFNRAGELLLGYSRNDLLGKNDYDFFPEEQADAFVAEDRKVLASEQVKEIPQEPITTAGGDTRFLYTRKIALRNEAGEPSHLLGISLDITDRKLAEEEQRIAATAFDSQEAMIITDANTVILRVNRTFSEITGYASEDIVGRTPRVLRSGRHDKAFYTAMWESINRSGSWQGEIWDRRKNGEVYPNWTTITGVKGVDGTVTHYVGVQTDITLRKAAEEEIRHLAFFDALTGLPNRRLLMDRLRQTLATSVRTGREGALMFIDLDNFKTLNDTLGHDKGDLLLQQVAERLSACVREGDSVARLGGDEFVVLLGDLNENPEQAATQAERVGQKILAALNQTYDLGGHQHRSTPSIGVTLFADNKNSVAELLKQADIAMYQAKAAGRNALRFFDLKA